MILDTSAVVAILNSEPERAEFEELVAANDCVLSSVSYLEVSVVLLHKRGPQAIAELDAWLETAQAVIAPFTPAQARVARSAYLAYGEGRHPSALNFGDCATYALAVDSNEPLLYKGEDFALCDVPSARATS